MNRWIFAACLGVLLAACAGTPSRYESTYKSGTEVGSGDAIEWLAPGQTPSILKTDSLGAELEKRRAEGYVVIGYSQFTGPLENTLGIQAQAEKSRATLVLRSALEVGRTTKYRRIYDDEQGYVYEPIIADTSAEEKGGVSYATVPVYRQTALFLARKKSS